MRDLNTGSPAMYLFIMFLTEQDQQQVFGVLQKRQSFFEGHNFQFECEGLCFPNKTGVSITGDFL